MNRIPWLKLGGLSVFILLLLFAIQPEQAVLAQTETCTEAVIHYHRDDGNYEGWGLHIWGPIAVSGVAWDAPFDPTDIDDFGLVWTVPMEEEATYLNYLVHNGDEKDPGPDMMLTFADLGCEIWLLSGDETQYLSADDALAGAAPVIDVDLTDAPQPGENQVLIHYGRAKNDYSGWGLHVWGPTPLETTVTWTSPLLPTGQDAYGLYWLIDLDESAEFVNYIVHKGDTKDPGPDQKLTIADKGREIWLIQGSPQQFLDPVEAKEILKLAAIGDITKQTAYWLSSEYVVWPVEYDETMTYSMVYSSSASINISIKGMEGGTVVPMTYVPGGLPEDLALKYPHLADKTVFSLPETQKNLIPSMLRGQVGVMMTDGEGKLKDITGLQTPGIIDEFYAYDGPLGLVWNDDVPSFYLWAPTASFVTLLVYEDLDPLTQPLQMTMRLDHDGGVWWLEGDPEWKNWYYRFEVDVYVPAERQIVTNKVTDPYSIGLSMNSSHSLIVDLDDPALKPDGWDEFVKEQPASPVDIVLYELHVRDFSSQDQTVPEEARGTFKAFTYLESNGMQHLALLAEAGLTHIHLLPVFDIATINENKSEWELLDFGELEQYGPASDIQQSLVNETRSSDGFNWGYDPLHYTTPEGSYSTNPNDATRILEFRQMVMALDEVGLHVVMDVVYNHTNAYGQSDYSVLDKIVPGYYHRMNSAGGVESSTCCANTASENYMMERLMIDSVLTWTTQYKVDGFRFDLMGHHMVSNMVKLREELNALTVEEDGVDGPGIYIYGEGWDFGEVENNARGINATQLNLPGTGIGTFNDRARDAARGGNPFGGLQEQGFINGLYTNPNGVDERDPEIQLTYLLEFSDQIRLTLAGNLAEFTFTNFAGLETTGAEVYYNGDPDSGYTSSPQENIVYVSAHDNETLFDAIQYKAPLNTPMEIKVRMQNMGISLISLSQGVPFFHAGSELLRSKNLDRDSYDSGDWFNQLDFTYQNNNWGSGLPLEDKNGSNWPLMEALLADPAMQPGPEHIQQSLDHFTEMLQIRKDVALFRLQTAEQIEQKVQFFNTGVEQVPGLIVMGMDDRAGEDFDPNYDFALAVFNATPDVITYELAAFDGELVLHNVLENSADELVRTARYDAASNTVNVPGYTTAVFVMVELPETEMDETEEPVIETTMQTEEEETSVVLPVESESEPNSESESIEISPWLLALGGGLLVIAAALLAALVFFLSKRKK